MSRVLAFQGAVGILFVDKFLYVRLFVCHRTCVLSYLRCAWVSEALGISVWATQRWQPVVLCGERFSYEVVPLVRPRAACVFVVSRAHVFVAGVVVFVVIGSVATIGGTPWQVCGFVAVCLFAEPRLECEVWPFMGNAVTSLTWNIPPQILFLMTLLFQS